MESALMISPPNFSASWMPTAVLPIPVGPQMTITFGFLVGETILIIKCFRSPLIVVKHEAAGLIQIYPFLGIKEVGAASSRDMRFILTPIAAGSRSHKKEQKEI